MRFERSGYSNAAADGCIYVVQELGGIGGVQIGGLGGVDDRTTTHRDEPVDIGIIGELDASLERFVGRFDPDIVIESDIDPRSIERGQHSGDMFGANERIIGKDSDPFDAKVLGNVASFSQAPRAKRDVRRIDAECVVARLKCDVVVATEHVGSPG